MKRLKTAEQARAEGAFVEETTWRADHGSMRFEDVESERETYWADRCEALESDAIQAAKAYAEALKERDARALDWHRVEDVLPPKEIDVLVWKQGSERLRVASLNIFGTWDFPRQDVSLPFDSVTHWALPTLPDGMVPRG